MRLYIQGLIDMLIIGLTVLPFDGKDRYPVLLNEGRGYVILSA
jgi:hypothetical protein